MSRALRVASQNSVSAIRRSSALTLASRLRRAASSRVSSIGVLVPAVAASASPSVRKASCSAISVIRCPPSFPETGRPEVFAPPNLCNALLSHPEPPVQTAQCRATPCYEPLWQTAAPCWGSRRHRERGVAASEGSEDATEVFAGLRSGRIGAKMPFEIPIHDRRARRGSCTYIPTRYAAACRSWASGVLVTTSRRSPTSGTASRTRCRAPCQLWSLPTDATLLLYR